MNLLKQKNTEIMNEINKMKQEVEDINKDNSTYLTLEKKYETLIKDVRKYEGELADYNLALDKYRSDTKPEDIEALYMHIKNQNDKQRAHLDNLFAEKRDMENEIQRIEQQITNHQLIIAALLEHMQKSMARQNKLPTAAQYKDQKEDLAFKQGQLENAENTYARLKVELEQR